MISYQNEHADLLEAVASASYDLSQGRVDKDYCESCGGIEELTKAHDEATSAWVRYCEENDL